MATNKKAEAFQPSGDTKRVISCGGGTYVRIGDHLGKWHHLSVERDADDIAVLVDTINGENPEFAARIIGELLAINADEFAYVAPRSDNEG
jgi:hypothetical protein